jgi:hypothetical protein
MTAEEPVRLLEEMMDLKLQEYAQRQLKRGRAGNKQAIIGSGVRSD